MARSCVLIVGGRVELIHKAKELDLRIVLLHHPMTRAPELAALAEAVLLIDFADWSVVRPLVLAAHEVFGFCAVVSTTEPGLEPAGRINDLLGLNGNPHRVSRLLRDKLAMREHLAGIGAATIGFAPVRGRDSLAEFGRQHSYPFIVKPVDASGSLGLQRVDSPAAVNAAWRRITQLREGSDHKFADVFPLDPFVMEEYVDGPEYSVEAFSFDGRHIVVAITEKVTLENFVERGHAVPAWLDVNDEAAVVGCIEAFLDDMGIRQGPTHTEVRLSAAGPRVIESHDRTGGDRIAELVDLAYGIDLDALTLAWPAGLSPALARRPPPKAAAATRFLIGTPGRVTAVRGVERARATEGIVDVSLDVSVGDAIHPLEASWNRIGQVLATAPCTDVAVELCERAVDGISVIMEPKEGCVDA